MVRRLMLISIVLLILAVAFAGTAFAANPHPGGTGQPGQSCQNPSTSTTPGQSVNSPGSPFNPSGVSGGRYNSQNSQYDVACFQNSQPHP